MKFLGMVGRLRASGVAEVEDGAKVIGLGEALRCERTRGIAHPSCPSQAYRNAAADSGSSPSSTS